MRKPLSAVLALGLTLTLTACAPQNVPEIPQAEEPAAVQTETQSASSPDPQTAAVPTEIRETQADSQAAEKIIVEGMEETVNLTQYDGQGYTIMIPDGQWRLESQWEDGRPEQTWESLHNSEVELKVAWLAELNKEQAQGFLMADRDDFQMEIQSDGSMIGRDSQDQEILFARFYPADAGTFILTYSYPDTTEMAEGFGVRLSTIADSFQLK